MADLGNIADLKTAINSRVNNNTSQDITPTDVRSSIVDTVDTLDALKEAKFLPTFTAVVNGVTKTYRQGSALVAGKQYYFDVAAGVPGSNMFYWTETAAPNGIWTLLVGGVSEAVETAAANSATPQDVPAWTGTTPVLSHLESTSQEAIEALAEKAQHTANIVRMTVTQGGASAPAATVLTNGDGTLGVWSRFTDGSYRYTKAGAFLAGKTFWSPPSGLITGGNYTFMWYRLSDDVMQLETLDSGTLSDEILAEPLPLEIITYP